MQLCALYVEIYKQKMYKPKLHILAFFCFAILYDKGGGGSYIKRTICDPETGQLDKGKSAHSAGTNCPYNRPIGLKARVILHQISILQEVFF